MPTSRIHDDRIAALNNRPTRPGRYVLYWMQQSQRARFNHALEWAIQQANELGLPVLVGFGLTDDYPEANARHYRFMLEGLAVAQKQLARRGVRLVILRGPPAEVAIELSKDAAMVVTDAGYLRHQRAWRRQVAEQAGCRVGEIEADTIVPTAAASRKAEWAARTIRPKLHAHLGEHRVALRTTPARRDSLGLGLRDDLDLSNIDAALSTLKLDRSVPPAAKHFVGGTDRAVAQLKRLVSDALPRYREHRNQPQTDDVSYLSMHLHFGQISPVEIALAVQKSSAPRESRDAFIEELLVRRELCWNFVRYNPHYDQYRGLPSWARKTLAEHRGDRREHVYSQSELEAAQTHDPYWNASMREMRETGYMHNYMRMYWGKKILEWSESPEAAFEATLALNNRYFIDGRDPNSYAGVGWVFGLHDRPWARRAIFGTVRYMSADGLKRKCDIDAYVAKVDRLVAQRPPGA